MDRTGVVFIKIYEYFLGKFAMRKAQKASEFFNHLSRKRRIA